MQHKQKKLIRKILKIFFLVPLILLGIFLFLGANNLIIADFYFGRKAMVFFLFFISLLAGVLDEIVRGEVVVQGRGSEIKKGEVGFQLFLAIHIIIVISIFLLFLCEIF